MRLNLLISPTAGVPIPGNTVNMSGHKAYLMTPEMELFTRVASCFYSEPKFYGEKNQQSTELLALANAVAQKDPEFIMQLAAYCRNDLRLRTVSVVLYTIAANYGAVVHKGKKHKQEQALARKWAPAILTRADEIGESLAMQLQLKGSKQKLPQGLKRALADRLNSFDAYALGKYNRDGAVKLKDVLQIVHPKPKNAKQGKLFKQLMEGTIESPDTWEVKISTKGSTKENWEESSKTMGYMALLRNLRNFLQKGVNMAPVLKKLEDPEEVLKSKQLPFRFLSAYREIQGEANPFTSATLSALSKAFAYSMVNVPEMKGVTVIALDQSGSMDQPVSAKSKISMKDAANTLGVIAMERCSMPVIVQFHNDAAFTNLAKGSPLQNLEQLNRFGSGGTNAGAVFELLTKHKIRADRVIFITDEQDNLGNSPNDVFETWKNSTGSQNAKLYSFNLAGYGMSQFSPDKPNIIKLGGFSERVFDFVNLVEQGFDEVVKHVKEIQHDQFKQTRGKRDEVSEV